MSFFQRQFSNTKKRYKEDGFDLNLSYVTDNILSFGYPGTGATTLYRNSLSEVQRFFVAQHRNHVKFYNLYADEVATHEPGWTDVGGSRVDIEFKEQPVCKIEDIRDFCTDAKSYLDADPLNVIAVYCKAGKGREGLMISSLLLHLNLQPNAAEAMSEYAAKRRQDGRNTLFGSQRHYVCLYERYLRSLKEGVDMLGGPAPRITISLVRMTTTKAPSFDTFGGCDPYVVIYEEGGWRRSGRDGVLPWKKGEKIFEIPLDFNVAGGFKLEMWDYDAIDPDDYMFSFWVNTRFLDLAVLDSKQQPTGSHSFTLPKAEIDGASDEHKSKFKADFKCEVVFTVKEVSKPPLVRSPSWKRRQRKKAKDLIAGLEPNTELADTLPLASLFALINEEKKVDIDEYLPLFLDNSYTTVGDLRQDTVEKWLQVAPDLPKRGARLIRERIAVKS